MSPQIAAFPSPTLYYSESSRGGSPEHTLSTMMVRDDSVQGHDVDDLNIQRALDIARNTEGEIDPAVAQYLDKQLSELWNRLQARPEDYVLTKDEFAVFNFNIRRFEGSEVAEKAIARFWAHHREYTDRA
ncbi:hypothetical protein MBLNU459_g7118t3 [Dothideomycetes sp. NU459]